MTCFQIKTLLFLLLVLATLLLVAQVERFMPVGDELLLNADFGLGMRHWQSSGPAGSVELREDGSVALYSNSAEKSIALSQPLSGLGDSGSVRLSAELATEAVVAGAKGWHRARLVLARRDRNNRWLRLDHEVVALSGDNAWRSYHRVFSLEGQALKTSVVLQLPHASGQLRARGLSLRRAVLNPLFPFVQLGAFLLWGGFLAGLLLPYLRKGHGMLLRAGVVLVVLLLLSGTLMPDDFKREVLEGIRQAASDVQTLLADDLDFSLMANPAVSEQLPFAQRFDLAQVGHFCLFTVLTLVLILVRPGRNRLAILYDVLLIACATELLQLFVAGRTASLNDLLIDAVGATLGVGVLAAGYRKS